MIKRLRPSYAPDQLEEMYRSSYAAQSGGEQPEARDHDLRIEATLSIAQYMAIGCNSGADLSAGHGDILRSLNLEMKFYGDAYYDGYAYSGPIEETISEIPHVDLFILTETLEHLDDPGLVLRKIREKANKLLLSTPLTPKEWVDDNPEHYWSWDDMDVGLMIVDSGWNGMTFQKTRPPYGYIFQIWGCE